MKNFEHIYIHWPFCRSKCYYCDFLSYCNKSNVAQEYHDVLCKQLVKFANDQKKDLNKKPTIKTIFLGGGTPSLYPLHLLEELFCIIHNNFDTKNLQEVTIESNPCDITLEKLKCWKRIGINRLSIGVQILDNYVLKKVGRNQTVEDVFSAIKIAPKYFENISVDLILGLPGVSRELWLKNIETVVGWPINHLSVYLLTLYKGTKLFQKIENSEIFLEKDDTISTLYVDTVNILEKHNFIQYETSNFAKLGFESLHNIAYWDRKPYLGLGLGASSFDGKSRFVNEKNMNVFLQKSVNAFLEGVYEEKISDKQELLEKLMLGLRQKKGMDLHRMLYFLKEEDKIRFLNEITLLKNLDLICKIGDRVFLTSKGMLLENEVVLKLI